MHRHWKSKVSIIREGQEPLPRCDHCGMHIPVAWMIKHRRKERCNKATEMWIRWRDVEMSEKCEDIYFSLYGREGLVLVELVTTFKYMRQPLDQTYDDCLSVRQNINQARRVCRRLGRLLIR